MENKEQLEKRKTRRGLKPERPVPPEPTELPEVVWWLDAKGDTFGIDGSCHEHCPDNPIAWHFLVSEFLAPPASGPWAKLNQGQPRWWPRRWLSFAARSRKEAVHMLQVQLAISGVRAVQIFEVKPPAEPLKAPAEPANDRGQVAR